MARITTDSADRGRRLTALAAAGLVLLVIVGVAAFFIGRGGSSTTADEAGEPGSGQSSGEATGTGSAGGSGAPEAELRYDYRNWLTAPQQISALPAPTRYEEGYAVGFPRTELGAVATRAAVYAAPWNDDTEMQTTINNVYALGGEEVSTASWRADLYLETIDEAGLPAGSTFRTEAYGYVVLDYDEAAGTIVTSMLSARWTVGVDGEIRESFHRETAVSGWDEDRGMWKRANDFDEAELEVLHARAPEIAYPDSEEFNTYGWTAIDRSQQ